jgi:NAD(P)-dependent dehydrogenase (short-subunit alcohol dehydrogenase family)
LIDRRILVTGSTDGIGKETALELAAMGAEVIVHGRTKGKAALVAQEIARTTGNEKTAFIAADFADLTQVRSMAAEVTQRWDRIHVLINNAGVYMSDRELTVQGFETTFAVNHLAPFLLTNLLLDNLLRSVPARIVTVSSIAHQRATLDFENLQAEKRFDPYAVYALSKLANILFTYELASRLQGKGVTANCLHPGVINTKLLRTGFGTTGATVEEGASTTVYLATSEEVEGITGTYFVRNQKAASSWLSRDPAARQKLWAVSARACGL